MKYGTIPYVKQNVSRLIFGTMVGSFPEGENEDDLLDAALAMGINTFDLARVYGKAEQTFGEWMEKRQNQDKLVILTKCGHPSSDWGKSVLLVAPTGRIPGLRKPTNMPMFTTSFPFRCPAPISVWPKR